MFNKKIKKLIIIEGMHCAHCAQKVENTLKSIPGITKVKVNLNKKEVIIISKVNIDNNIIEKQINNLDFKVLSIN